MAARPFPPRNTGPQQQGCMVVFGLVFLLMGLLVTYVALVRPLMGLVASQGWTEARCSVLSSRVAEVSGSRGSTYAVDIRYMWVVGGIAHTSSRYNFLGGSSSGRAGKQAVVDRYPPGALVPCWIDPADPTQAVLDRSLSPSYLIGLVPLVFVAFGLAILLVGVRSRRTSSAIAGAAGRAAVGSHFGLPLPGAVATSGELRPAATPLGALLGLILFALFWNGILSVFVWMDLQSRREGHLSVFLTLFLVPFVLVGLGLIFAVGRQLLKLFNPRPHLTLTPRELTPGGTAYLEWKLGSGGGGVRRVKITFEGRKESRSQSGRNTYSDRETFLTVPVVDSTQPLEIAAGGSASFTVPAGAVPSFRSQDHRIVWSLKVHCEIAHWPDGDDEYEVIVRPAGGA
jgi:hypothetical protein